MKLSCSKLFGKSTVVKLLVTIPFLYVVCILYGFYFNDRAYERYIKIRDITKSYHQGIVKPEDVFLYFTKTPKTSGTVAANLIAHAYEKKGLHISANCIKHSCESVSGSYGAVSHSHPSLKLLETIRQCVQRPLLLVVSVREGKDWIKSASIQANRYTRRSTTGEKIDKCLNPLSVKGDMYSRYLPFSGGQLYTKPWWVLRHENIVEDTCQMLSMLGMNCDRRVAVGQVSRENIKLCSNASNEQYENLASSINEMNEELCKSAVHHWYDLLERPIRDKTCRSKALGPKWH